MILYNICLCFPYVTDLFDYVGFMSKNIFSQAHTLGLSEKTVFYELDFCCIQFPFVSFVFPKTEVSEVVFDTHFTCFSLETF